MCSARTSQKAKAHLLMPTLGKQENRPLASGGVSEQLQFKQRKDVDKSALGAPAVHKQAPLFHSQRCRHTYFVAQSHAYLFFLLLLYLPQSIHHPAVCTYIHMHTEWTTKAANEQECPQISETARQLSQQGVLLLVGCCSQPTVACNQTMACLAFPATGLLILYSETQEKRPTGRKEQRGGRRKGG